MRVTGGLARPGRKLIVFVDSSLTGYDSTYQCECYSDLTGRRSPWRATEYPRGVTIFHLWGKGLPEFAWFLL